MSLDLIEKLRKESQGLPEVIAPVLKRKTRVRVAINGHPYSFLVEVVVPGWYIFQPVSSTSAEVVRIAEQFEIRECLNKVRSLRTISVRRLTSTSWLVFPFNLSDAKSRGFLPEPQECYLVDRNLEPFMVLRARLWSSSLLFDASGITAPQQEYKDSLIKRLEQPSKVPGLNPEFGMVYDIVSNEIKQERLRTIEGRIRDSVEYLGAELIGYSESGQGYIVEWRDGNNIYKSRVGVNFRLQSAGVCLNGREYEQTLTSTVAVMRGSRQRQYFYEEGDHNNEYD